MNGQSNYGHALLAYPRFSFGTLFFTKEKQNSWQCGGQGYGYYRYPTGPAKSWNLKSVLESRRLSSGFLIFFKKSWKSPEILQNVCPMSFLWLVVFIIWQVACILKQGGTIMLCAHSYRLYKVRDSYNFPFFPQVTSFV